MDANEEILTDAKTLDSLRGTNARERMLHRLHCVILVLSGLPVKDVCAIFGDSPRAVAYWLTNFKEKGVSALEDDHRSGRRARLNEKQTEKLRSFVQTKRKNGERVNADVLSAYIKKVFGVSYTERQYWRILKQFQ